MTNKPIIPVFSYGSQFRSFIKKNNFSNIFYGNIRLTGYLNYSKNLYTVI